MEIRVWHILDGKLEKMIRKFFISHKLIFLYGVSMAALLMLLKWLELRYIIYDHAFEVYAGSIAVIFTALGIWLAVKLIKPKTQTVIIEKQVYIDPAKGFVLNEKELASLGMSKRELEVLQLMADGMSNREIASRLFVSENTIKTHASVIFEKLDVQRRTQAVDKAKKLRLIP